MKAQVIWRALSVVLVLAVIAGACVAGYTVLSRARADEAAARRVADAYTPPPPSIVPAPVGPVVVVTDSLGYAAARDVPAAERWARLLSDDLQTEVRVVGGDGAGYLVASSSGTTFGSAVAGLRSQVSVVVFLGGAADAGQSPTAIGRAASGVMDGVRDRQPSARVIMVGPTRAVTTAASATSLASAYRRVATVSSVEWVDPTKQGGWISRAARDGRPLSAADHRALAGRLAKLLRPGDS